MKRLLTAIIFSVLIIFSPLCHAAMDTAETYTDQSILRTNIQGLYILQVVWRTADNQHTAFTSTILDFPINGYIMLAETIPTPFTSAVLDAVTTAKGWSQYTVTDNYDITITDDDERDLMGGALANRSAVAKQAVRPLLAGSGGAIEAYSHVTLNISGNTYTNAVGALRLWILLKE